MSSRVDSGRPSGLSPAVPAAASDSRTTSARRRVDRFGRCFRRSTLPSASDPTSVGDADGAFEPYPDLPAPVPVCVTQDDVEAISSRLYGAASPGGTDAVDLANWLVRFGRESEALREEMAAWTN